MAKQEKPIIQMAREAIGAGILVALISSLSVPAFADNSATTNKTAGRFVALQPPSAGNGSYGNFLWVLDTVTGKVVAYRISKAENSKGEVDAWITERLLTEEEYAKYLQSKNKDETTPEWVK